MSNKIIEVQDIRMNVTNELTVLSNLESHNAELIKEGKSKEERFEY